MPLENVMHTIHRLKEVAGGLAVREIVTTVKCNRTTPDGAMQRVTIEILYRTASFANRYEIQARTGSKTATGKANSLDEALRSVHWQDLDPG